jgi:hypothetical protein
VQSSTTPPFWNPLGFDAGSAKKEVLMNSPFKAYRSLAFALMLGTAAIATTLAPSAARAWDYGGNWTGSDGSTFSLYYQVGSDGQTHFAVYYERDGKAYVNIDDAVVDAYFDKIGGGGDPSPDGNGTDQGIEPPNVAGLIKDGLVTIKVRVAPADSPQLSQWTSANGFGFAPHGNPGDTDTGNQGPGQPPKGNTGAGLTPKQQATLNKLINELAKSGILIGQGMGTGEEGGTESAPTLDKTGGSKGKGGDGSGRNNGRNHTIGMTMSLGPRPDVVNPPLKAGKTTMRISKAGSSTAAIAHVGAANVGTSNPSGSKVIAAGLLEGGNGFGQQGPSGIGTPLGAGGSKGTSGAALR